MINEDIMKLEIINDMISAHIYALRAERAYMMIIYEVRDNK
jgi:hypothetical protein